MRQLLAVGRQRPHQQSRFQCGKASWRVLTKLRANLGLPIATMAA